LKKEWEDGKMDNQQIFDYLKNNMSVVLTTDRWGYADGGPYTVFKLQLLLKNPATNENEVINENLHYLYD
jgi:hypothetical protein